MEDQEFFPFQVLLTAIDALDVITLCIFLATLVMAPTVFFELNDGFIPTP